MTFCAFCFLFARTNSVQVFKVNMQADTIGNRLKEVQDKTQNLATFGMFDYKLRDNPF
jgi:hypothetical protein